MSAPVRFLVVAVAGWAAVRAVALGDVAGFTVSHAREPPLNGLPPIAATQFPPLPPVDSAPVPLYPHDQLAAAYPQWPAGAQAPQPYYVPYPYALPAAAPALPPPRPEWSLPSRGGSSAPEFYSPIEPIDEWEVSTLAAFPERESSAPAPVLAPGRVDGRLDRLQLSSWALLRGSPAPGALATGGTLGGSQAGARLTYAFNPWLAASLRTTSPVGGSRGAEVAAGVRVIPFRSIPVAITAERRQAISPHGGGRSAFALFAEGGLYRRPMPWSFNLDAYVQAGIVGLSSRDLFVDGAFAFTRPVYGRFSAGMGVWGGAQPGVYRIDAGPRISVRVRDNIHAHLDWRQRIVGNAEPASGPALTLAADF